MQCTMATSRVLFPAYWPLIVLIQISKYIPKQCSTNNVFMCKFLSLYNANIASKTNKNKFSKFQETRATHTFGGALSAWTLARVPFVVSQRGMPREPTIPRMLSPNEPPLGITRNRNHLEFYCVSTFFKFFLEGNK